MPPLIPTPDQPLPNLLPDQLPMPSELEAPALLAFRTPLQEHTASADGKSATLLTILGILFTLTARFSSDLSALLASGSWVKWPVLVLLAGFAATALGTMIQAFRTLSPRFPKAPPSLAFFGDIIRLSREEYLDRVQSMSNEEAFEHILHYNHTVSTIIVQKLRQLRRALALFKFAFSLWLVMMALVCARSIL